MPCAIQEWCTYGGRRIFVDESLLHSLEMGRLHIQNEERHYILDNAKDTRRPCLILMLYQMLGHGERVTLVLVGGIRINASGHANL